MAAASLIQAAALASENVQRVFQTNGQSLQTRLSSWVTAIATAIPDSSSIQKRTVTNWIPGGSELVAATPAVENLQTQTDANAISLYVWQTCTAAAEARLRGNITAGEQSSLLASFNAIFP